MQTSQTDPPICRSCRWAGYYEGGIAYNDLRKWKCNRVTGNAFNPVEGRQAIRVNRACEDERSQWNDYKRTCGPNGDFFEAN